MKQVELSEIQKVLFKNQDIVYQKFTQKLIPTIKPEQIIGVRTPLLRKICQKHTNLIEKEEFLNDLPHRYYEENNLQVFYISKIREYDKAMVEVERFLPYIDNWATCDSLSPKIFMKNAEDVYEHVEKWIDSKKTYMIRFGVGVLMSFFLEDNFRPEIIEKVVQIQSKEYYVNMMCAWFMATALAKQFETVWPYFQRIPDWQETETGNCITPMYSEVYQMAMQKAVESYRIESEIKAQIKLCRKEFQKIKKSKKDRGEN